MAAARGVKESVVSWAKGERGREAVSAEVEGGMPTVIARAGMATVQYDERSPQRSKIQEQNQWV